MCSFQGLTRNVECCLSRLTDFVCWVNPPPICSFWDHQQITFEFLNKICLLIKEVRVKEYLLRKGKLQTKIFYQLNIFTKCFIIKINELKTILCYVSVDWWYKKNVSSTWLISKLGLFGSLFEEIEYTAKAESSMQVFFHAW